MLDLFLLHYGCWTYEVHTMSLIWRVIVAISQTMEKKSFPGRAESSVMSWTFSLFTTVHNVFFVQFEFLPTEQAEAFLVSWYTIYHIYVPGCSVGRKTWFSRKPWLLNSKGAGSFHIHHKTNRSWVHWPSCKTCFWPFGAHLDSFGSFQTKLDFLLQITLAKKHFVFLRQKIKFCLKWSLQFAWIPYLFEAA